MAFSNYGVHLKYPGKCKDCGKQHAAGDYACYDPEGERGKKILCLTCSDKAKEKNRVIVEKSFEQVVREWEETVYGDLTKICQRPHNQSMLKDSVKEDREEFRGSTNEDLRKMLVNGIDNPDTSLPADLREKLQPVLSDGLSKFRTRDEWDGEVKTFDHLLSEKPYTRRKSAPRTMPLLEIDCHLSANCDIAAESMRRAGQFLAAIVNHLEANGTLIGLNVCYRQNNTAEEDMEIHNEIRVRVKNPHDYLSPSVINAVLTPEFFRGPGFCQMIKSMDDVGQNIAYGLGSCSNPKMAILDGKFILSLGDITNNPSLVIQEFLKILNSA